MSRSGAPHESSAPATRRTEGGWPPIVPRSLRDGRTAVAEPPLVSGDRPPRQHESAVSRMGRLTHSTLFGSEPKSRGAVFHVKPPSGARPTIRHPAHDPSTRSASPAAVLLHRWRRASRSRAGRADLTRRCQRPVRRRIQSREIGRTGRAVSRCVCCRTTTRWRPPCRGGGSRTGSRVVCPIPRRARRRSPCLPARTADSAPGRAPNRNRHHPGPSTVTHATAARVDVADRPGRRRRSVGHHAPQDGRT
jgi:hypothetical protein